MNPLDQPTNQELNAKVEEMRMAQFFTNKNNEGNVRFLLETVQETRRRLNLLETRTSDTEETIEVMQDHPVMEAQFLTNGEKTVGLDEIESAMFRMQWMQETQLATNQEEHRVLHDQMQTIQLQQLHLLSQQHAINERQTRYTQEMDQTKQMVRQVQQEGINNQQRTTRNLAQVNEKLRQQDQKIENLATNVDLMRGELRTVRSQVGSMQRREREARHESISKVTHNNTHK
jgi:septal ring factor EnvC (AmiA/AmiB activator)